METGNKGLTGIVASVLVQAMVPDSLYKCGMGHLSNRPQNDIVPGPQK